MRPIQIAVFCVFSAFCLCARIPDLISPAPDSPFIEKPKEKIDAEKIELLKGIKNKSAKEEYELGLFYILSGDLNSARIHIQKALELKPNFLEARIQLGFIDLWEGRTQSAEELFQEVLKQNRCDQRALFGLGESARMKSDSEARDLYLEILICNPEDVDTLFHLGQIYRRANQIQEAKKTYLLILKIAPNYEDAVIALAGIYEREKEEGALQDLSRRYPHLYELQHIHARMLANSDHFSQASQLYERLAPNQRIWTEKWGVKSRTNISASLEATYTDAKESDPTLREPVVKDYYFYSAANVYVPVYDKWRVDAKVFLYHQRENDILPPTGVNYNVYISGGQLLSHYYFAKDWRWDITARAFDSWGSGKEIYPFHGSTRFEPGTSIILSNEHLFILDAHIESFIIKNFALVRSQMLRTDYIQGIYGYRPEIFLHPKVDGYAGWVYYHDSFHNWKNRQSVFGQMDLYFPELTAFYLFEHAGFQHLNPNYFSYKRQIRHTIEVKFRKEFRFQLYLETFWDHTWEVDENLFLPIGDFVFVAPRLYLIWNTFAAQMGYRYKDKLKIELGGHYLHNSLPYTDWNIHGNFIWQF